MVQRMSGPGAVSATALSKEIGVSQSQLSRWLLRARTLDPMGKGKAPPVEQVQRGGVRTAEEKVRIVMAAAGLGTGELGAFLRRQGVHEAELEQWRAEVIAAATAGLASGTASAPSRSGETRRIKDLERQLRRKDKALAEAAALLILQKKVRELWGDEDDDTDEGNGK